MSPTPALAAPAQERLGARALLLAIVLLSEALALSTAFDSATIAARGGSLASVIRDWAPWALKFAILFGALFGAAVYLRRIAIPYLGAARQPLVRPHAAFLHLIALCGFIAVSRLLFGSDKMPLPDGIVSGAWIALAGGTALTAALIVLAPRQWLSLLTSLWTPLAATAAAAAVACFAGISAARLWEPVRWLTFTLVQKVLSPILPALIIQPERFRIATGRFGVVIAPECSGLEGIGLLLIFGVLWTAAFHRTLGVARCAGLLAGASFLLYGMNVIRIAVLVLIGHAGARDIAQAGFHSQAGWIAFSTVALGLTFLGRRIADRSEALSQAPIAVNADTAAEPLLVPFLASVAAGMVAGAFSGRFEWLYGLRVAAAAAALWWYRRDIRRLPWKFPGAPAAIAGVVAFAVWIGLERLLTGTIGAGHPPPSQLNSALGWCWIAVRALGAVVTVPVVEELAFRGYLLRRLQSAGVDSVPFRSWTVSAVLGSSVLFGVLHGSRWIAGIAAGLLYAWAGTRRGNLADAVTAHALTNALIAALVLFAGAWKLW